MGVWVVAALKRIPKSMVVTEQQKRRLEEEKFILEKVSSPFLCRGFESVETTDEIAFVQEYIEGRPLYECVWKYRETGRIPEHVAKFFAAQLVLALRDLHAQGFAHRDFKSGNVLVAIDGFVKVIDFGLAKRIALDAGAAGDPTERTQSMVGTHYVMAPEVSLGVVIYEMVVGHPPWEYQCPPDSTMDAYFHRIECISSSPFQADTESHVALSADLRSLVRSAFFSFQFSNRVLPRSNSHHDAQVMHHAWFQDIAWGLLEIKDASVVVLYDSNADYNAARVRTPARHESISSAESVDPEDNAKYFADF
ncbi:unnamed protein product [Phytophthora fragariaefolia]|uniref:Unnamed protein product n=1 Tax=Phytophthora fragariaefolia TaxID=1490495 RepID=A0A9W7CRK3_9STRA|nr:unnamed protein product [Phytophthora fragariaefolia]